MLSHSTVSVWSPAARYTDAHPPSPERGADERSIDRDLYDRFGNRDFASAIIRQLELEPGQTMIDVGCGTGRHLLQFAAAVAPGGRALGIDCAPDAVAVATRAGASALVADGAGIPVISGSIDALCCNFVAYDLSDLACALAEWWRVLRPGGRLVVSGPASDTDAELFAFHRLVTGRGPSDADHRMRGFVTGSVRAHLADAGFAALRLETFTAPIVFPSSEAFLAHWQSTGLFKCTVPDEEMNGVIERASRRLYLEGFTPTITRRVSILVARKA